jgi:PAS domain S-box-containing protein
MRYAVAVISVTGAVLLHFLLAPYLGNKTPFLVFYLSIVVSALFGGFGPGILATLLAAAAADYFFIEPAGSFTPSSPGSYISLAIFSVIGFLVSYLSRLRLRSETALALHREQLRARVGEINTISTERREIEERYRRLFASMQEGLILAEMIENAETVDFRYLDINPAAERILGVNREQFIGQTARSLISDAREEILQMYAKVAQTGEPLRHEIFEPTLGQYHENFAFRPEPGQVAVLFWDITERKQAEAALRESEGKFRTLGEAIPNLAWLGDAAGKALYVNPAWSDYTGMTLEELNAGGWQTIHAPEELIRLEKLWRESIDRGRPLEIETLLRRADGVYRWFSARTIPLKNADGGIIGWVGTMTDIDELKQAEEVLKEANRNKELFLATLAHELRNPLAPVRSGLEIVRRSLDDRETVERTIEIIERQTTQLYRLVDDLLDISRITHGKIRLQKSRIALREAVELAIETSRGFIEKRGCRLDVSLPDEPIYLDADLTRVAQIILNLLNNAAKYNKPEGSIHLKAERADAAAIVRVSDTGVGIPSSMLANIFEPYNQIADDTQTNSGIGIGLSVVKKLVEMHGGDIAARSDGTGKGSEFTVRLPLAAEQQPETVLPVNKQPTNDQFVSRRVLIVDDNEDAAAMLEFLLKLENYEVRTAHTGNQALETAAAFEPEIALLDIGLPDLSGYELGRRLREKFPALRLLAVSGWGQEEDRRRSAAAGFEHHLVKPVEFEELLRLIRF